MPEPARTPARLARAVVIVAALASVAACQTAPDEYAPACAAEAAYVADLGAIMEQRHAVTGAVRQYVVKDGVLRPAPEYRGLIFNDIRARSEAAAAVSQVFATEHAQAIVNLFGCASSSQESIRLED